MGHRTMWASAVLVALAQAPAGEAPARFVNPPGLATPTGYTHLVDTRASRVVYVAGQVAADEQGRIVGAGDFGAQVEQVFRNLETALGAVGLTMKDVVKTTTYVVGSPDLARLREVRARYFGGRPPANTLVRVAGLAREEFLVEIDAVAVAR